MFCCLFVWKMKIWRRRKRPDPPLNYTHWPLLLNTMMSVASKLSGTLASEQTANTRVSIPRFLPAVSVDVRAGPSRPSSTQKEEDRASAALLEMSRRQDKTTPAGESASIWRGCQPGPEDLRFAHNVRHPPFSSTVSNYSTVIPP
jgi:hypothetical protein